MKYVLPRDTDQLISVLPKLVGAYEIKPYKPRRSNAQNNLLWKWHSEVAAEFSAYTGKHWTADQIHYRFFCPKFLKGEVVGLPDGSQAWASETSSHQNKQDMSDAMTEYQVWCLNNGIELTAPDEG